MTDGSSLRKQVEDFNNLIVDSTYSYDDNNAWVYYNKSGSLKFQPFVYKEGLCIDFFKLFEPVFKRRNQKQWIDYGFFFTDTNDKDVDVDIVRNLMDKNVDRLSETTRSFVDYSSDLRMNIDVSYGMSIINKDLVKTIKKFKIEMEDMIKNFEISFKRPSILDIHHYILRGYKTENSYILRANRMDVKNVFFQIKEKKIESPLRLHTVKDGIQLFDIWELQKLNSFYNEPIKTEQDLLSLKMEFLDSYFEGFQHCSNSKVYLEPDTV